jgi:hypothetical protein
MILPMMLNHIFGKIAGWIWPLAKSSPMKDSAEPQEPSV